ncbi:MAG TPA: RNA polymerase sigma factor [Solirubrobacteraceae bacterium]
MPASGLSISSLYARHRDDLLVFLVRRTADVQLAVDLWAETFAQALASQGRYRGSGDEEAAAWLYAIARHQLARYYRRGRAERRAMTRLGIERPVLDPETEDEIIRRAGLGELRRELELAVATLSDDVRAAITLRVIDELPYSAVASELAISEQAARARVSRGLRTLGSALDIASITETLRT